MFFVLPLYDRNRPREPAYTNYFLIGMCASVYLLQQILGFDWFKSGAEWLVNGLALVPRELVRGNEYSADEFRSFPFVFTTPITYQFVHGSILHLAVNMFFLRVFGDDVEDRLGHFQYLLFFLLAGIAGAFLHVLFSFNSGRPTIGASGSIMGVMAAYMILFSQVRVRCLILIFILPLRFWVPAILLVLFYLVNDLLVLRMVVVLGPDQFDTAILAHLGGFAAGFGYVHRFKRFIRPPRGFTGFP